MSVVPIRGNIITQRELRDLVTARNARIRAERREIVLMGELYSKIAEGAEIEPGRHELELKPIRAETHGDWYRLGRDVIVR